MKNVILKRTVAVIFIFVLLCVAVLPCFAINPEFHYISYSYTSPSQQGNINSMFPSWAALFSNLYIETGGEMYFFELQNSSLGGTPFSPGNGSWIVSDYFSEDPYGVVAPIYKFYLPYNNGVKWNFKIMTDLGNVVFDSSLASFTLDSNNGRRGYFEFEWSRNALGSSWYIYSSENAPYPDDAVFDVVFNYYNGSTLVDTQLTKVQQSYSYITLDVPHIVDYYVEQATVTTMVLGNLSFDIPVVPYSLKFQEYFDEGYDDGFDEGYDDGRASGLLDGYSNGYRQGDEDGYQRGFEEGYELGNSSAPSNPVQTVSNPLSFVLDPVVSFLNINFLPGLSIGLLLAASITVSLVVIFLRIFAGG